MPLNNFRLNQRLVTPEINLLTAKQLQWDFGRQVI